MQPEHRRCLDPDYARETEARKPLYEWRVQCTYTMPDAKGRLQTHTDDQRITARTEADAWAMFCDRIQHWPGPNACERTITRLNQVNGVAIPA